LGVNLGKNKITPLDQALQDYRQLFHIFAPLADYLVINVSSPNTEGLRSLQARQALRALLSPLIAEKQAFLAIGRDPKQKSLPLLVKLSPDLEDNQLDDALEVILEVGVDGVIATNTTVDHHTAVSKIAFETGGLSGLPLRSRAINMVHQIHSRTQGKLPVIGVGGVDSPESARKMLDAGANLVQIYTGLVYQGPGLVRKILRGFDES